MFNTFLDHYKTKQKKTGFFIYQIKISFDKIGLQILILKFSKYVILTIH